MEERTYKDNSLIESNYIDFQKIFLSLKRRKKLFIVVSSILLFISIISTIYKRVKSPEYLATFSIMIRDPILDNERDMGDGGSGFIESIAVNNTSSDLPTLIVYLTSEEILSKTAEAFNITPVALKEKVDISVPFAKSIRGKPPSIIKVDISGPEKNELLLLSKSLSQDYLNIAFMRRQEKLTEGIKFLNKEKPILEARANNLQNKLETFRLNNKVLDPIEEGDVLVKEINDVRNLILELESENIRLLSVKDNLIEGILFTEGVSRKGKSGLGVIGSDQLLLEEILEVKASLAKAQSTYKNSSSVVLNLQAKLNQLEPILLENQKAAVDAAIIINDGEIRSANNKLIELESEFKKIPELINGYTKIINQQLLIEENLEGLFSARESLELELSQGTIPWRLISKPYVNPSPFKPDVKKELIYGFLISLFSGLAISLLIDKLDNVYHSIEEVEIDKSLPSILGQIPYFKINREIDDAENNEEKDFRLSDFAQKRNNRQSFIFEETFRNIYTSIKFSSSETYIKTLCITSSVPSEGKSSLSAMLGINTSELDKKILVIDGDLRRPTLHEKFSADNISGLSNILTDERSNWRENLRTFKNYPNLSLITGGKIPPNAMKLLNSNKMKSLINEIKESDQFDLIIIDSPPLIGLSDSLIISEFVDAVVLTISLNKVKRNLVQESLKRIRSSRSNCIGVLVNNVEKDIENISYSKYGYLDKYIDQEENELDEDENLKEENSINKKIASSDKKLLIERLRIIKNKIIKWLLDR